MLADVKRFLACGGNIDEKNDDGVTLVSSCSPSGGIACIEMTYLDFSNTESEIINF